MSEQFLVPRFRCRICDVVGRARSLMPQKKTGIVYVTLECGCSDPLESLPPPIWDAEPAETEPLPRGENRDPTRLPPEPPPAPPEDPPARLEFVVGKDVPKELVRFSPGWNACPKCHKSATMATFHVKQGGIVGMLLDCGHFVSISKGLMDETSGTDTRTPTQEA